MDFLLIFPILKCRKKQTWRKMEKKLDFIHDYQVY